MKHMSIHAALQNVADNPVQATDEVIQLPAHELVCRSLFEIANRPDAAVRGSMARANKARKIILERLVGKRRAGSHPATLGEVHIEYVDMTGGELHDGGKSAGPDGQEVPKDDSRGAPQES